MTTATMAYFGFPDSLDIRGVGDVSQLITALGEDVLLPDGTVVKAIIEDNPRKVEDAKTIEVLEGMKGRGILIHVTGANVEKFHGGAEVVCRGCRWRIWPKQAEGSSQSAAVALLAEYSGGVSPNRESAEAGP